MNLIERNVLRCFLCGLGTSATAESLRIDERAVRKHLLNLAAGISDSALDVDAESRRVRNRGNRLVCETATPGQAAQASGDGTTEKHHRACVLPPCPGGYKTLGEEV